MSRTRIAFEVKRGALTPADGFAVEQLRAKRYKTGEIVMADLYKARNPRFNRLAHALGGLISENIEAFSGLDSHSVLKRLQIEANVGCDEIALSFPGVGPCSYRVPRSLSFDTMDEVEFQDVMHALCKYVSKTYWPTLKPEQIEAMAEAWLSEAA